MEMGRAGRAFLKMASSSRVRHRPCRDKEREREGQVEQPHTHTHTDTSCRTTYMYMALGVTHDKDGDEAGERGVPVSTRGCCFPNQNTVEDEVS